MKRSRPTIAMLLAAALTFTTVCPALAAEGGVEAGNAQTAPAATEEMLTDEMEMTEDPAYGAGMDAVPDQDDASEADNVESGYTEEAPAAEEAVEEADPAGVQETEEVPAAEEAVEEVDPAGVQETEAPAAEEAVEEVDPAGVQETEEVPVQDSEEGLMEESEENLLQDSEEDFPQDLEEVSGEDLDNTEASTDDESASEEVIEENLDSQNEFNTITDSETVVEETLEQNEKKEAELAEDVIDSGICGDDVIWTLSEDTIDNDSRDYILVISGYGEMYDIEGAEFTMPHSPWRDYVHEIRTIIIEDGVTSIGDGAFKYCSFSNITIPNSISRIGEYAFSNCDFMENIEIPYGITKIESHVFYESNCYSLESITIPDGVISIGDYAFFGCESLQNITIPDSVTNIEEYAFYGCRSLQNITIPNGVTNIGECVFSGCDSLQTITIPDSITNIEEYAFFGCDSLQTITIPDGVTNIGRCAFRLCSSLQNITIPNGVTNIGEGVFSDCDSLQTITIPDSITNIEEYAFYGCDRLQTITIPDSVTTIGESAFYGCESLQSITIPRSVTSIKQEAFYNCSSFKSIFYAGTKAEWDAIDGSDFYLDIDNLVLHTSDGDFCFIRAEKITLNKTSATLVKGASLQLKATVTPANASDAKVTWKTNNSKVLTVSGTGKVTAVAAGTATITAVTGDGTIKAICTIKVVNPYTIKFNKNATKATLSTTSKKVNPGSAIGALPTPKYSGYYFQGWYTEKTGGTKVSTSTKPSKSMTLYARWVKRNSISKAIVKVASCTYSGKLLRPSVTVKLGTKTLKLHEDYSVVYSNNLSAGSKALVKITGIGKYKDSISKRFTIDKCSMGAKCISAELSQINYNYSGKAKKPGVTIYLNGRTKLTNGIDYKVSYMNNVEPGTGKLIVTGIDNFKGTLTKTFKINKILQPAKLKQAAFTTQYNKIGTTAKIVILDRRESANITYSSTNTKVAVVKNGVVTIKGTGSATIKISLGATKHYKAKTLNYAVNVLKKQTITTGIQDGSKIAFTTSPVPLKAAVKTGNGKLSYKSSDTSVVKVDSKGNLIFKDAAKLGTATITITASTTSTYTKATKSIKVTSIKGKPVLSCAQTTQEHDYQDAPFSLGVSANESVKLEYVPDRPECAGVSDDGIVTLNPDNITDDMSLSITVQSKANTFFNVSGKITLILNINVKSLYWPVRTINEDGTAGSSITGINSNCGEFLESLGIYHRGIDIAADETAGWFCPYRGTVEKVYYGCIAGGNSEKHKNCSPNHGKYDGVCNDGFGNGVVISFEIDGVKYYAQFAHMSEVSPDLMPGEDNKSKEGMEIERGTYLGKVGNRGFSFGTHAHFEINQGSQYGTNVNNDPESDECVFKYSGYKKEE